MPCWNSFLIASCLAISPSTAALLSPPDSQAGQRQDESGDAEEVRETRPESAKALFERFAKMEGLEVSFSEKKHIALLALPLESQGKIYFMRPGYLTRVIEAPSQSKLTITPIELRMTNADGEKVIDLRQNAELCTFVTSLLRVFSGEREKLELSYKVLYELDPKDELGWSLTLEPRAKPLNEMLRSLQLFGSGSAVARIEMHEPNGDKTVTKVLTHDPKRRFSAKEQLTLFGIPDPKAPKSDSEEKAL